MNTIENLYRQIEQLSGRSLAEVIVQIDRGTRFSG
jgi:hypothetical protein